MPMIEITEAQRERIEDVRAALEEHRLGPYGTIRTVDAVEFLLDHYETGTELAEKSLSDGERAGEPETAEREDGTAEDELQEPKDDTDDEAETKEDAEVEEDEEEDEDVEDDEEDEAEEAEEEDKDDEDVEDDEEEIDDEEEEADDEEDEDGGTEDENGDDSPGRLNAMMQLLDEHDDKWAESDSENGKYDVTLPDGTTESVRTKDDIRALLFKHY